MSLEHAKKCINLFYGGPYEVGAPDSLRISGDSHPNCRCRRIPVRIEEVYNNERRKQALIAGIVSASNRKKEIKKNEEATKVLEENFSSGKWKDEINP